METPSDRSLSNKQNILSLIHFVSLDQIPKLKIYHMVESEHTEVIEGRRRLIATDIPDTEEVAEDGSIDDDGAALDEYDASGSGEAGVSTGVTEVGTKEAEEVHQAVKYSSIYSFMLKPTSLLTQVFIENKKAQENLFKNMCNFGAWLVWRNGRRYISSYLDVDTIKYQYRLINPTPLDCIKGYTMEDAVGNRDLKRLTHISLNLIDVSISSYFSFLYSPERLDLINQAKKFASVLDDIESYRLGEIRIGRREQWKQRIIGIRNPNISICGRMARG